MYYVYIIQSKITRNYYIGYTSDVQRRLDQHNQGKTRSTKAYKPWELVFTKGFESKRKARQIELKIKKMKSHKFIERLINKEIDDLFYGIDKNY
ncbi:MAG: GIY-YIG nuclease family protein [Candidatus Neomarinimicrobiota bacterium]|jgi:putative endonuclease